MSTEPIVILGAGLSGLSLTCALLERSVRRDIVLVDRRSDWSRDHTWCTWSTPGLRFLDLASHRWNAWEIRSPGRRSQAHSTSHPYVHLRADHVYAAALARIEDAGNVSFQLGEPDARIIRAADGRPALLSGSGVTEASLLFDARGPVADPSGSEHALIQSFRGVELELDVDVFDPTRAILMDFIEVDSSGLRFMYVLPFSPRHALIEDTFIGSSASRPDVGSAVETWLERAGLERARRTLYEEAGELPMSPSTPQIVAGAHAVGAAGGAIRPSSGYAFSRIQRECSAIATAVAEGGPLPSRVSGRRTSVLDQLFLTALSADARQFPEIFHRLCTAVPGDCFARFMTDTSSGADDLRVISALPRRPFLRAARSCVRREFSGRHGQTALSAVRPGPPRRRVSRPDR